MAYNEDLTNRVREALTHVPNVKEVKAFRGALFMVDGKVCVSTGDTRLMCRIDPEIHDTLIKKKGVQTMKMKTKEFRGYVYVDEAVLKTKKDLEYWIGLALDFNPRAKASPSKKKKPVK